MKLYLGIDGGGSKTRALLAQVTAGEVRVLGSGSAGSSNYRTVGLEAATSHLREAIAEACREAGYAERPEIASACLGLAGVNRNKDKNIMSRWAAVEMIASRVTFVNDVELVLAAGCRDGWGVALIGGTGSIAFARAVDGRETRAGGWGYILGDEGSGYSIALSALRLATQTADGRAQAPALLQAVLDHWRLKNPGELLGPVYRPDITIAEIAGLATRIVELAEVGDSPARELLDLAAAALARLVDTVTRKLALIRPPVALAGGVLRASPIFRSLVGRHIAVELGPSTLVADPAIGAVLLASRDG